MGHYIIFVYQLWTSLLSATFALLFGPVDNDIYCVQACIILLGGFLLAI